MTIERPRVLLVGQLETRFSRDIFHGVARYVRQHTNWRLICQSKINLVDQRKLRPVGMLAISGDPELTQVARQSGVPLVLVGHSDNDPVETSVSVDESVVGKMAAEHLAGLGLKHFAFVGHGPWGFVKERMENFARAVEALGFGPVTTLVGMLYDRRMRPRFEKDLRTMLHNLPKPCGLLAANDAVGVEIVAACQAEGLQVPDDIAVVGVDNDEVACELSDVPLSSVAQPLVAIGYESGRLLHQMIEDRSRPPTQLRLPPARVVARASSDLIALEDPDVVGALRLIRAHFAEPIGVEWIVKQLPVARRSLERRFKALVGRTILEQIHHERYLKAKELLAESTLSLDVVAQRCGFVNARWMADCFRRDIGVTPNRFRKRYQVQA